MFGRRSPHHAKLGPSVSEVSDARFKRFVRDLEGYERKVSFQRTLDGFLDVYSTWKKTHAEPLKLRLVMLAFELHRLDHEFECELTFDEPTPCAKSSSRT